MTSFIDRLRQADARLDARGVVRPTLAADRSRATPLAELGRAAADVDLPSGALEVLADGLIAFADAIVEHFPENIFWDLDFVIGEVCRQAKRQRDPAASLVEQTARLSELQALYGQHTAIRFRYVHDFVYGFDWAKWVKKDPAARGDVRPFDPTFLGFSHQRSHELLALIDEDDGKYPQLRDERHRNPFGFVRDPDSETKLFHHLARRGLLPVEAWRWDHDPAWNRPFADDRKREAVALGLGV